MIPAANDRYRLRGYIVNHAMKLEDAAGLMADAEYVALAQASGTVLVTSDRKLHRIFPEVARSPERFLEINSDPNRHE